MSARSDFTYSLTSALEQIESGAINDLGLPGSPAFESGRLVKNGLAVAAFASFEDFIKGRIAELLRAISDAPDRPVFENLPPALQTASTIGVIDAMQFRLSGRSKLYSGDEVIKKAREHAGLVADMEGYDYRFSEWSFGHASSNISAGTIDEFLAACNSRYRFSHFGDILKSVGFDYAAAGLAAENGQFSARDLFAWRHASAHNAGQQLDVELLTTRIVAYLAVASVFDYVSSRAVSDLISQPPSNRVHEEAWEWPVSILQFQMRDEPLTLTGHPLPVEEAIFSVGQAKNILGDGKLALDCMIAVRSRQGRVQEWFFRVQQFP